MGIAARSAVVRGRELFEDAVRRLARAARTDLGERVDALLATQTQRFTDLTGQVRRGPEAAELRAAAAALARAADESARS